MISGNLTISKSENCSISLLEAHLHARKMFFCNLSQLKNSLLKRETFFGPDPLFSSTLQSGARAIQME